jgi:flagellar protein FlgJ
MRREHWAAVAVAAAVLLLATEAGMNKIQAFIANYLNAAKAAGAKYKMPAWLILTQAAHESGYGLSGLTRKAMNFFGFTADSAKDPWVKNGNAFVTMPTTEYKQGKPYATSRKFRAYPNPQASFEDYARLLTTSQRYAPAVAAARAGDVAGAFEALGTSGYATDPRYGFKLAGVYAALRAAGMVA